MSHWISGILLHGDVLFQGIYLIHTLSPTKISTKIGDDVVCYSKTKKDSGSHKVLCCALSERFSHIILFGCPKRPCAVHLKHESPRDAQLYKAEGSVYPYYLNIDLFT